MAERTGCPILLSLWSYVTAKRLFNAIFQREIFGILQTEDPEFVIGPSSLETWFCGYRFLVGSGSLIENEYVGL